jgi:hypothetical protein
MGDHSDHDAHMARLQRVLDRLGEVTKQASCRGRAPVRVGRPDGRRSSAEAPAPDAGSASGTRDNATA